MCGGGDVFFRGLFSIIVSALLEGGSHGVAVTMLRFSLKEMKLRRSCFWQ